MTREGDGAAGLAEGIPYGAALQVLPNPPPHRSHTCFDPKQIRCGTGGGSCDGEKAINSGEWACCPRRLEDRQEDWLKELSWGKDGGRQATAWPGRVHGAFWVPAAWR